jgi:phenylalanyl-tRNA synthetase alpha subunit
MVNEDLALLKESLRITLESGSHYGRLQQAILGKEGLLTAYLHQLGSLSTEDRKIRGLALNQFKTDVEALFAEFTKTEQWVSCHCTTQFFGEPAPDCSACHGTGRCRKNESGLAAALFAPFT